VVSSWPRCVAMPAASAFWSERSCWMRPRTVAVPVWLWPATLTLVDDPKKELPGAHPLRTTAARRSAADRVTLSAIIGLETALASSLGALDTADPL
jgi:hypothetical protein